MLVRFTVSSLGCNSFWCIQEHKWHFVNSPVRIYYRTLHRFWKDFDSGICYNYGSWFKAEPNNEFEAQRMLCRTTLNLGKLVKPQVSHTKSEKRQLASKSLQRSHTVLHFCTPLSPVPSPSSCSSARPELCTASAISQSSDIQTIFGSTPLMMKVEVLWIIVNYIKFPDKNQTETT